jgi:acetyl esterase/lipase
MKRTWRSLGICAVALGSAMASRAQQLDLNAPMPGVQPAAMSAGPSVPPETQVKRNVAYGPDGAQTMDIYLPAHVQGAPVILMVHGGAWTMGDKSIGRMYANKVAYWIPKGYIFISINNRLLPAAAPLEQANDVARALAFAQHNASTWGGDPARFVLMGHSAGAHLVDLLAANPGIAYRQGARAWLGTISLDTATLDVPATMSARHYRFYDDAFGRDPAYWAKASPMQQLTAAPKPMLLVCSTMRPDHPCPQAQRFADKVRQLGGRATVLPEKMTHREINEQLGLPGHYTDAVESFLHSLTLP